MSDKLLNIVRAVNEEIAPQLPKLKSERSRIEMRSNLLALSRMCMDLRKQLLEESKTIKQQRKENRNNKNNKKNVSTNIQEDREDDA